MRKREVNKYGIETMKELIENSNNNESIQAFPGIKRKKKEIETLCGACSLME